MKNIKGDFYMSIEAIGKQIASLRKEKGARQEELAKYVGVSAQAVSKWENGGVPDIELLPKIADFFSVSIDSLFNRNISDSNLQSALMKKIIETPNDQQIKAAFDLCWDIERALMPHPVYTYGNRQSTSILSSCPGAPQHKRRLLQGCGLPRLFQRYVRQNFFQCLCFSEPA